MKQEIIRLGSACNQKCLFCNQEEIFSKKSKKHILFELLSFRKKGVERLVISGGEPTLFKEELLFTISTGKKLGFEDIEIQSNAVLLENSHYVESIFNAGLSSAMISLHSFDEKISDDLTQAKGTFNKTLKGIHNLIKIGIKTELNIVINNINYKNIIDYLSFIKDTISGFRSVSLSIVVPGKLTIQNNLLPNYAKLSSYLIKAYDFCIKNNIDFQNPGCGIPVCFVKDYYKYSLEYQNFKREKRNDEFILEKNSHNKMKSEKCKECFFDNYCLGFWKGYVELHGFEGIQPILEL